MPARPSGARCGSPPYSPGSSVFVWLLCWRIHVCEGLYMYIGSSVLLVFCWFVVHMCM